MHKYLSKDDYGSGDNWIPNREPGSRGKTVTTSETYLNADRIYAELISSGEDWADKDAAASLLEEGKKALLAQLSLANEAKSRVEAEGKALASHEYQEYIAGMVEARKAANKARVRYSAIQTLAELRRSQESTRRAELKVL